MFSMNFTVFKKGFSHFGDSYSNFLNKINIISAASFLFRINFKGVSFVESNGFLSNVEGESIFI